MANVSEFVAMWASTGANRLSDRTRSQPKPTPATVVAMTVPTTDPMAMPPVALRRTPFTCHRAKSIDITPIAHGVDSRRRNRPRSVPRKASSSRTTVPKGMATRTSNSMVAAPTWTRLSLSELDVAGIAPAMSSTTATIPNTTPPEGQTAEHPVPGESQSAPVESSEGTWPAEDHGHGQARRDPVVVRDHRGSPDVPRGEHEDGQAEGDRVPMARPPRCVDGGSCAQGAVRRHLSLRRGRGA